VNDLESQRRAFNAWGKNDLVTRVSCDNTNLTPAQRTLADSLYGHLIACGIERLSKLDIKFLSRGNLSASSGMMAALADGAKLGLWKEADGKSYYTHTNLTRPFMLTALALHDERRKSGEERASGS